MEPAGFRTAMSGALLQQSRVEPSGSWHIGVVVAVPIHRAAGLPVGSTMGWVGAKRYQAKGLDGGSPGEIKEGLRLTLLCKMPIPLILMCGSISVAGVSASCVKRDATK